MSLARSSTRISINACLGQRTLVVPNPQAIAARNNSMGSHSAWPNTNSRRMPSCSATSRSRSARRRAWLRKASGHGCRSGDHLMA